MEVKKKNPKPKHILGSSSSQTKKVKTGQGKKGGKRVRIGTTDSRRAGEGEKKHTTVANLTRTTYLSAYLRIKFPEEVNKSAMKKTCSALNTGQRFLPLSVANIKSQLVQKHQSRIKTTTGLRSLRSLTTTTTTARVNSRDAATMLREEIGAIH